MESINNYTTNSHQAPQMVLNVDLVDLVDPFTFPILELWGSTHSTCPPWCPRSVGQSYKQSVRRMSQEWNSQCLGALGETKGTSLMDHWHTGTWWPGLNKFIWNSETIQKFCHFEHTCPTLATKVAFGTKLTRVRITSVRLRHGMYSSSK
jgi:hypothetical protein